MSYELDSFNIEMARVEAETENWALQEEADNARYKQLEEAELRKNAKKTCTFCNEFGHAVFQMGILFCPRLKQTSCSVCGLLGHTHRFCIFLKPDYSDENIRYYIQQLNCATLSENTKIQTEDCIRKCKQKVAIYRKQQAEKIHRYESDGDGDGR